MGIFKTKNSSAFTGDGYYDTDPVSVPATQASAPPPEHKTTPSIELKVVSPTAFDDVSAIADYLLADSTVFLNIENTPPEAVRRIIDFLSGVAYSINGQIKKVTTTTYIITPSNVDVSEASDNND